jgi:hypothetical protein
MALKSFKEDFLPEKVNVSECFEKMHVVDEDVSKFDHARLSRVDQVLDFLNQVDKINALFLIDLTGSMGAHLDEAKKSMTNVYRKILLSSPHARLSVSIIGYRDYDNNSNISPHYEILPFTESISTIATFMANLEATGGTDDAEDVVGALAQALDQDWTRNGAGTKVLLHIADAPCHGSLFHSPELTDRYPDGDPRGIDPADILKQMAALNIHYYFAKISVCFDLLIVHCFLLNIILLS